MPTPKTLKALRDIHKVMKKHELTIKEYLNVLIGLIITFCNQYNTPIGTIIKILEDTET